MSNINKYIKNLTYIQKTLKLISEDGSSDTTNNWLLLKNKFLITLSFACKN